MKLINNLRWIQSTWAGVNTLVYNEIKPGEKPLKGGFVLTKLGGCFGPLMTEYCLGFILNRERHWDKYRDQQQQKSWKPVIPTII